MKFMILEKFKLNLQKKIYRFRGFVSRTTTEKEFSILVLGTLSIESMWTFEKVQFKLFKYYKLRGLDFGYGDFFPNVFS